MPPVLTVLPAAGLLVVLVVSGGYRRVELVGVARGLFELAFVAAAVFARPSLARCTRRRAGLLESSADVAT